MKINPTIREDELDDDEKVEMIASGYEWICPNCADLNREIEIMETVVCETCGKKYKVGLTHHAHG